MKNPLRGLRFSLLDFHSARANVGMKIAMLGIALIPLIYGALYLMAFYDPYGKLDTLPVTCGFIARILEVSPKIRA